GDLLGEGAERATQLDAIEDHAQRQVARRQLLGSVEHEVVLIEVEVGRLGRRGLGGQERDQGRVERGHALLPVEEVAMDGRGRSWKAALAELLARGNGSERLPDHQAPDGDPVADAPQQLDLFFVLPDEGALEAWYFEGALAQLLEDRHEELHL